MTTSLIDSFSYTLGKVSENIALVKNDVRSVAEIVVHNNYLNDCIKEIKKQNCKIITLQNGETHTMIYLFKYSHLIHIVNYSINKEYNKNTLLIWLKGRMFGYSEKKIEEYIKLST